MEKERTHEQWGGAATKDAQPSTKQPQSFNRDKTPGCTTVKVTTTGWQPTCTCNADTVPCVVLDPFGGSGTTAKVARDLKRDCTLIELNPAYIKIAKNKLRLNEQLVF